MEGVCGSFDYFSVVAVSYPVMVGGVADVDGYGVVADVFECSYSFDSGAGAESLSELCMDVDVFECCFSWF